MCNLLQINGILFASIKYNELHKNHEQIINNTKEEEEKNISKC